MFHLVTIRAVGLNLNVYSAQPRDELHADVMLWVDSIIQSMTLDPPAEALPPPQACRAACFIL